MKMTLSLRRPREQQRDVAMGWFTSSRFDDEVIWKDGGTGGFATFVGYSTRTQKAAILLSNANDYAANTSLALNMINPAYPAPKIRRAVPVDPALLAAYVGRYQIVPSFVLTVRADDGHLFVQARDKPNTKCSPRARRISSTASSTPSSPSSIPRAAPRQC